MLYNVFCEATVCPRSSDPFYKVKLLNKMGHYFSDTQYLLAVRKRIEQVKDKDKLSIEQHWKKEGEREQERGTSDPQQWFSGNRLIRVYSNNTPYIIGFNNVDREKEVRETER